MNTNQINSAVRTVLLLAGASLVAQGNLSDLSGKEIVGALLAAAATVWDQYYHKKNPPAAPVSPNNPSANP